MKNSILIATSVLLVCAPLFAGSVSEVTVRRAQESAKKTNKLVAYFLSGEMRTEGGVDRNNKPINNVATYNLRITEENNALEKVIPRRNVVVVNAERGEDMQALPEAVRKLNKVPGLIIVDAEGKVVASMSGAEARDDTNEKKKQLLEKTDKAIAEMKPAP